MKLEDMTFEKMITPKTTYVIPSLGRTYDKEIDAKTMVSKTANIGQYWKFYEVFYAPSYTKRTKRYTKFMMIMTRKTVAIHSEVTAYMTNTLGLTTPIFISDDWGWRDNWIIKETDYSTCGQVYDAIQKCMTVDGGNEPGGNELLENGVGTLHIIKFDGSLIYAGTPTSSIDIFENYINYDPNKIDTDNQMEPSIPLDGKYI